MLYRIAAFFSLVFFALLSMAQSQASIAGIWKHESESGWIKIDMAAGTGTIVVNEKYPERVGEVFLRDLTANDSGADWIAQIYVRQLDSFRQAKLSMPETNRLRLTIKMGFLSRSVDWVRAELPAVEGASKNSEP